MGIWRLLGKLVKISKDQTWFITDENAGRLIYEEYDPAVKKSSEKSRFYVVKFSKLHPKTSKDGEEIIARCEVDLADSDMVEELAE